VDLIILSMVELVLISWYIGVNPTHCESGGLPEFVSLVVVFLNDIDPIQVLFPEVWAVDYTIMNWTFYPTY